MAAVAREESISCSQHPPTWFKQPWLLPQTGGEKEETGQSPTCRKLHNFPLPLGFSAGKKIKFPTQTDAFIFPGRSGLRAALSGVKQLGGFTLLAKTYWEMQEKKQLSPQSSLTSCHPPVCKAFLRHVLLHLHHFPLSSKSLGSFLRKWFCRYRW